MKPSEMKEDMKANIMAEMFSEQVSEMKVTAQEEQKAQQHRLSVCSLDPDFSPPVVEDVHFQQHASPGLQYQLEQGQQRVAKA